METRTLATTLPIAVSTRVCKWSFASSATFASLLSYCADSSLIALSAVNIVKIDQYLVGFRMNIRTLYRAQSAQQ